MDGIVAVHFDTVVDGGDVPDGDSTMAWEEILALCSEEPQLLQNKHWMMMSLGAWSKSYCLPVLIGQATEGDKLIDRGICRIDPPARTEAAPASKRAAVGAGDVVLGDCMLIPHPMEYLWWYPNCNIILNKALRISLPATHHNIESPLNICLLPIGNDTHFSCIHSLK